MHLSKAVVAQYKATYRQTHKQSILPELKARPRWPEGMHHFARSGDTIHCTKCNTMPKTGGLKKWAFGECTGNPGAVTWHTTLHEVIINNGSPTCIYCGGFRPVSHADAFKQAKCGTPEPRIDGIALPYTWRRYLTYFPQIRTAGKKFRGTGGYNNRKRFITADMIAGTAEQKRRIFAGGAWIPHTMVTVDAKTACATCCKTGKYRSYRKRSARDG